MSSAGSRGPIAVCYALTGVLSALWGATLPATDARLELGAGRLGVVLLVLAAGSLAGMPAGWPNGGARLGCCVAAPRPPRWRLPGRRRRRVSCRSRSPRPRSGCCSAC